MKHTKRWTKEEDKYLLKNYKKQTYREIAENLGRSVSAVLGRSQTLNIQGKKQEKLWTEDEIDQLKKLSSTTTIQELSKILKRTAAAIRLKMFFLGLKPFYKNKIYKGNVKKYLSLNESDLVMIEKEYGSLNSMIAYHISQLKKKNEVPQ